MALTEMAGHLIRRMHQNSGQIFTKRLEEAGYDLTSVQFATLYALHEYPGIEQAKVASLIFYDRATIGGVIDRLEQKGYVTRVVSKKDRRAREVRLTRNGEQVFETLNPIVEALQSEILGGLTEDEIQQFLHLSRKVLSHAR